MTNYLQNINSFRTVTPLSNNNVQKAQPQFKSLPNDTVELSLIYSDLKENEEKSNMYSCEYSEGKINGQESYIKFANSDKTDYIDGKIGDKTVSLKREFTIGKSKTSHSISGEYNNKPVNISIDFENKNSKVKNKICTFIKGNDGSNNCKTLNIKGTIGDKEIDLKIPGADVPKDSDTRDMLALMLCEHSCFSIEIARGKICNFHIKDFDTHMEKEEKERSENKTAIKANVIMPALGTIATGLAGFLIGKLTGKQVPTEK